MELWQASWRKGFVPVLSRKALEALRDALVRDDPRLLQGSTTDPLPYLCMRRKPCEGGCAISFCGWQGEGIETVGKVDQFFIETCEKVCQDMREGVACRWFLNWFDDTPRDVMRRELLPEVNLALESKS